MEEQILNRLQDIEKLILGQKDVLTFEEACKYAGVSRSHLYKLTSTNRVPHSKPFGKMLYFDRLELNRWLLQNPVTTVEEIEQQAVDYCYNQRKGGKL